MIDVLLGLQWGDEGKGKIVDVISPRYDIVARFQGGPNAGHTIEIEGEKQILHTIPSGIFHPEIVNLIGNGVIIDPFLLVKEIEDLQQKKADPKKNLLISNRAHLILPTHRLLDVASESLKGSAKIGSTLKGIGPTYTDKTARSGLRICEIFRTDFRKKYNELKNYHLSLVSQLYHFSYTDFQLNGMSFAEYEEKWLASLEKLKFFHFVEGEIFINAEIAKGKKVLAEGAQGTLLDVDFGSYPFVTSSNTITAGACTGLGVAPHKISRVYGIVKAYCTRVGSGPFPTELEDETGEKLRNLGKEFGSTTGRPRRCGWLDLPALRYAIMLNGVTDLILTKADVLDTFDKINICTHYESKTEKIHYLPSDILGQLLHPVYTEMQGWMENLQKAETFNQLPGAAKDYIAFLEKETGIHFEMISTGPGRKQILERKMHIIKQ